MMYNQGAEAELKDILVANSLRGSARSMLNKFT